MLCTECDRTEDAYAHDAKNPAGHFFSLDRPTIADRGEELRAERKPEPVKVVREQREPRVPTLQDYKWWVRSYRRQRIIRDLAASRLALHDEALERVTLEADPPEGLFAMVLTPDLEGELREIANQLTRKLEIRKRPPVECSVQIVAGRIDIGESAEVIAKKRHDAGVCECRADGWNADHDHHSGVKCYYAATRSEP